MLSLLFLFLHKYNINIWSEYGALESLARSSLTHRAGVQKMEFPAVVNDIVFDFWTFGRRAQIVYGAKSTSYCAILLQISYTFGFLISSLWG